MTTVNYLTIAKALREIAKALTGTEHAAVIQQIAIRLEHAHRPARQVRDNG